MQIHDLNNFSGELDSTAYLGVDNGIDTGKVSVTELLADVNSDISELDSDLNGRIDNIIAGPAPSAQEVTDARRGADGVTYSSLGTSIRSQVTDLKSDYDNLADNALGIVTPYKAEDSATSTGSTSWENFSFLQGTKLKKGCTYAIKMVADSAATGNIYISIKKKSDNTNLTTCHIVSNTTSKTVEVTPTADVEVYAYLEINLSTVYTITGTVEKLNVDTNVMAEVRGKANTADLKPSSFSEYKGSFGFAIGSLDTNGALQNWPYRISSDRVYEFDFPIVINMGSSHQVGYVVFASTTSATCIADSWSGWFEELIVPQNMAFKLQCRRKTSETSSVIDDAYDNDIYNAMNIVAEDGSSIVCPIKLSTHNDTRLWEQGACAVGDKYIGFSASNDDHSNTATAWIGDVGDFINQETITQLGSLRICGL